MLTSPPPGAQPRHGPPHPTARSARRGFLALLGTLLVAAGIAPPPAYAVTRTEKTFNAWTVVCIEDDNQAKRCSMLQSRVRTQDKQLVILWSISTGETDQLDQSLTVPVGISIKEGVRLFVDDRDPATLGYDFCGPRVCIAQSVFSPEMAQSVKQAKKASASYVLGTKQLMQVDFDLDGFGEAYDYLVEQIS